MKMMKIRKNTIGKALQNTLDEFNGISMYSSIANIGLADVLKHFDEQKDSSGNRWRELSDITKRRRRQGKGSGDPIPLQDTKQMIQSGNIDATTVGNAIVSFIKWDSYFNVNVPQLQNDGGTGYYLNEETGDIEGPFEVPPREFMYLSRNAINDISDFSETIANNIAKGV